jgi:2-polyprenyl-3-methyl-5-hydroxy-6-metoxy-1,4-benzoquinol methylase
MRTNDLASSLERDAGRVVLDVRRARRARAASRWLPYRLAVAADDALRTDRPEHLDEPDYPADRKLAMVRALHRMNQLAGSYGRFLDILEPHLRAAAAKRGGPARALELASGSGELTLALATRAAKRGLAVEVTGSDYVPAVVAAARARAAARGVPVQFEVLNAFDLEREATGRFDVVFTVQSMHHFSPGQLATIVAQSSRVATTAFVGIDGRRSAVLLAALPAVTALTAQRDFIHDAWLSARKFYPADELRALAQLAAPTSASSVTARGPFSVLTVAGRAM